MSCERRIQALRKRHAEIDLMILAETARPAPDHLRVHKLKSEKLNTKDEIARLVHGEQVAA